MSERKDNLAKLKKDLEVQKQQGHAQEVEELLQKIESQNSDPAQCNPVIYDCCTITLAPESIDEFPYGWVDIGADFFFLECCKNKTTIDAWTPCGTIENACKVNEIKAVGNINYVTSFVIPTFYNNGRDECDKVVHRRFSCTGTACVNNTLCYAALHEESPCPDFCDSEAFAFVRDIDYCSDQKAIVTIGVVFVLPECNNSPEPLTE